MANIKIHVFHTGEVCVAPDLPFGGDNSNEIKASGGLCSIKFSAKKKQECRVFFATIKRYYLSEMEAFANFILGK